MGRIKSTLIKRTSKQLLQGENKFTSDFNKNKRLLVAGMPSKPMRNKIAGYLARLKKMEAAPKAPKKIMVEEQNEEPLQAEVY